MRRITLDSIADTVRLGRSLADLFTVCNPGCVLLYGPMGAGKTTLTSAIVTALPGGSESEPSSPSFTICNIYCTAPPVHHYDLYRLEPGTSDESLAESLDSACVLTMVEWPEHMAAEDAPDHALILRLSPAEDGNGGRIIILSALGERGEHCLERFLSDHSRAFSLD